MWALTQHREATMELQSLNEMYQKSGIPTQHAADVQSSYSPTTEKVERIKTSQR